MKLLETNNCVIKPSRVVENTSIQNMIPSIRGRWLLVDNVPRINSTNELEFDTAADKNWQDACTKDDPERRSIKSSKTWARKQRPPWT